MEIELRLLRCALRLAEYGNFARAAKALHMSQPSLTRNIQDLERRVGISLFNRGQSGVEPTEAGVILLEHSAEVMGSANALVREMDLLRGTQKGELHVAAGVYPGQMFLDRAVGRLVRDHPAARLSVSYDNAFQLLPRLLRREFDFSVMYVARSDAERLLDVTTLQPHRWFFAVRHGHPLSRQRRGVSLAQIQQYPVATTSRLPPSVLPRFKAARREAAAKAASHSVPSVGCDSLAMIRTIVLESEAVGILPLNLLLEDVQHGRLVALPTLEPWDQVTFSIARLKSRSLSSLGQKLVSLIVESDAALKEWEEQNAASVFRRQSSPLKKSRGPN